MRFSIRLKIILLSGLSFLMLIGIAMFSSLIIYRKRAKADYIDTVDRAIEEAKTLMYGEEYIDFIQTLKENIKKVYDEEPINDDKFDNFNDKYEYYRQKYANSEIYPGYGLDGSRTRIENRKNYLNMSGALASVTNASGGIAAYIGFYDFKEIRQEVFSSRFVYLVDSRYRLTDSIDESKYNYNDINLPGSYYEFKDNDEINIGVPGEEYYGCVLSGKTSRYVDLFDLDGNWLAVIFIEYDESIIDDSVQSFAVTEIIAFMILAVILMVIYAILASVLLVNNIKKLNEVTDLFTKNLLEGKELEVIEPNIKTHDEVKALANSYITLEKEIINYTKKIEQATREKEKINAELQVATKIQLEALPLNHFNDENILIEASIESAKEVGGDFYDYFYIDKKHLAIIISDVSGKGIPAALFMMKAKELIKSKLLSNKSLEDVCFEVNNELIKNNEEGLFITAFVGILNIDNYTLDFVNAGHEKPYIIRRDSVLKLETKSNFILGGINDFKYQKEAIKLKIDDRLFLFTDGLNESINEEKEEFGYERIKNNLEKAKAYQLKEIIKQMKKSLKEFTNSSLAFDDITMLLLEIKAKQLHFRFEKPEYDIILEVVNKMNDYYSYLKKEELAKMGIIIDELLNNIIQYNNNDDLFVEVNIGYFDNKLVMKIINNGNLFNPLEKENKYIEDEKDLIPGGLGISIVKELVDDIIYDNKNNLNNLTISKITN